MKPEIAKIWCESLLSGEYEQGWSSLSFGGKYCCLGVLCELAIKNGVNVIKKNVQSEPVNYNDCAGVLPTKVKEWAGMKTVLGEYLEETGVTSLAGKNDGGMIFAEIAKIIQARSEDL